MSEAMNKPWVVAWRWGMTIARYSTLDEAGMHAIRCAGKSWDANVKILYSPEGDPRNEFR